MKKKTQKKQSHKISRGWIKWSKINAVSAADAAGIEKQVRKLQGFTDTDPRHCGW